MHKLDGFAWDILRKAGLHPTRSVPDPVQRRILGETCNFSAGLASFFAFRNACHISRQTSSLVSCLRSSIILESLHDNTPWYIHSNEHTFCFSLKLKSSPGEELQSRQHDDPKSPCPSARRGCRLHRVRQADAVHGQVSKTNCTNTAEIV